MIPIAPIPIVQLILALGLYERKEIIVRSKGWGIFGPQVDGEGPKAPLLDPFLEKEVLFSL